MRDKEDASSHALARVKALTFDVFGAVVDWRGSIIAEGHALDERLGVAVDWAAFADRWRGGYGPAMQKVREGVLPWTKIDDLHRMILDEMLVDFGLEGLDESEIRNLNRAWHRLDPWPDVIKGLVRLKKRYLIAPLSNGNMSLLTNMAKRAGLPWDCVLSAELAGHYKPDPEVYLKAAELLGLEANQVMMVAAHPEDLHGAAKAGFRTALVIRPLEFGAERGLYYDLGECQFDLTANDFEELATALGA